MHELEIPFYFVLGFEGDGKTSYIKNILELTKITAPQQNICSHLLVFEDGYEKYTYSKPHTPWERYRDPEKYTYKNSLYKNLESYGYKSTAYKNYVRKKYCSKKYSSQNSYFSKEVNTLFLYEDSLDPHLVDKWNATAYSYQESWADRVIIECNGMQKVKELYKTVLSKKIDRDITDYTSPRKFKEIYKTALSINQKHIKHTATVINAAKFEMYFKDMYELLADKLLVSDLIIFNRCDENTDFGMYREMVHSINPNVQIVFEGIYGQTIPYIPYTIDDEIIVNDEDFDTFYIDVLANLDKYVGKTVKINGLLMKATRFYLMDYDDINDFPLKGGYLFGRYGQTFGMPDSSFMNFIAEYDEKISTAELYKMEKNPVQITAEIKKAYDPRTCNEQCRLCISEIKQPNTPNRDVYKGFSML